MTSERDSHHRRAVLLVLLALLAVAAGDTRVRPDDPIFPNQWALENTGQEINGRSGTPGADIDATRAWALSTGSAEVVVAVLDGDLDVDARDLAGNVWVNPGGVNGCPAGSHGYHVPTGACEPHDDAGHGTLVSWLIGAEGDNGRDLTGVNWHTSIMGVSVENDNNDGTFVDGVDWIIGARQAGVNVRVINFSAGYLTGRERVRDAVERAAAHDILLVTGAGNTPKDNDTNDDYPCNFDVWNVICVTASDQDDQLVSGASWGDDTVDLAAPGTSICNSPYNPDCGSPGAKTSWSAAITSGAAALVWAHQPDLSARQVKARLLGNVDRTPGLAGKVATGGRLNVYRAMIDAAGADPGPDPTPSPTTSTSPTPAPTATPTPTAPPTSDPTPAASGSTSAPTLGATPTTASTPTSPTPTGPTPTSPTPTAPSQPAPAPTSTPSTQPDTTPPLSQAGPIGPSPTDPPDRRRVPRWVWVAVLTVAALTALGRLATQHDQPPDHP